MLGPFPSCGLSWGLLGTPRYLDARALIRLQADTVGRTLVPAFYRYLQAQEEGKCHSASLFPTRFLLQGSPQCLSLDKQIEGAKGFIESIEGLVTLFRRAESEGYTEYGLWNARGSLSYADAMAAPCQYR